MKEEKDADAELRRNLMDVAGRRVERERTTPRLINIININIKYARKRSPEKKHLENLQIVFHNKPENSRERDNSEHIAQAKDPKKEIACERCISQHCQNAVTKVRHQPLQQRPRQLKVLILHNRSNKTV